MRLTDAAIRRAKATSKPRKLSDGAGLYVVVPLAGSRWFRFDYRLAGKQRTLSLGTYPEVTLKQARERRDEARKLVAAGVDPSEARKAEKAARTEGGVNSFEAVAREWFAKQQKIWDERHAETVIQRLEANVFSVLGARPIGELGPRDLLAVAKRIEARGAHHVARRTIQVCGQVFRYAVATGRAERDPSGDLRGALTPTRTKHHASLTDTADIGGLLRAIDGYKGSLAVRCALQLAPLTFVRPGELRHAEWSEFNTDAAQWLIPAEKMKMRDPHIVPLSRQALEVLRELHPLTGNGRYLFPSERTRERPISENTVNAALRRMGFTKDEMTGHGFRSMASTILNGQGWNRDAIERQLAHAERNKVRAAYNFSDYLPERRKMMQAWADHLDALKNGAKVIPIGQAQAR